MRATLRTSETDKLHGSSTAEKIADLMQAPSIFDGSQSQLSRRVRSKALCRQRYHSATEPSSRRKLGLRQRKP